MPVITKNWKTRRQTKWSRNPYKTEHFKKLTTGQTWSTTLTYLVQLWKPQWHPKMISDCYTSSYSLWQTKIRNTGETNGKISIPMRQTQVHTLSPCKCLIKWKRKRKGGLTTIQVLQSTPFSLWQSTPFLVHYDAAWNLLTAFTKLHSIQDVCKLKAAAKSWTAL